MIEVALYQPEIPPNTGNVIRLRANTGAGLHLVHPLGFRMEDRELRRAGLDYHEYAQVAEHQDFKALKAARPQARMVAFTTKAQQRFDRFDYAPDDLLLFGPESRGLPPEVLDAADACLRIPMRTGSRSLNLSNAVAVAVFQALLQLGGDSLD